MKALVYTRPNEVTYRDEPEPRPAAGEVVIGIDAVGICGSDMHAFHGRDPRRNPPLILGHELAGRSWPAPASADASPSIPLITCGRCDYCRTGRDNLCSNRTMIGMTRPGGFAEQVSIRRGERHRHSAGHECQRRRALTEPAATALHAIDRRDARASPAAARECAPW